MIESQPSSLTDQLLPNLVYIKHHFIARVFPIPGLTPMDNEVEIKAPTMDNEGGHTDWLPTNFKICTSSEEYITGIVSSEEELKHLLENHKRASGTSYTVWSDDSHKKQKVTPRCLWKVEDYSEHVPLSVKRRVIYACQHGKNYKKTTTTDDLHTEHDYRRRKRFHIQNSKKVDCPAKLCPICRKI
nr:uncharacterized protein LOC129423513 isoform X2 [Misgurnus anguillicaudatus]